MELIRKLSLTGSLGIAVLGLACSKAPANEPATNGDDGEPVFPAVGSIAKELQLKDLDGKVVKVSDFGDKTVLLDFWATWCPDCVRIVPGLKELHQEYSAQGFEILGINYRERDGADPAGYAKKNGYPWKILLEGDEVGELYQVRAIPAMFLIHKGKIIYTSVEEGSDLSGLRAALKKVLRSQ